MATRSQAGAHNRRARTEKSDAESNPKRILDCRRARIFGGFMNKARLLIVVPVLLVALGAQTPTAGSNSDPTSIKGCLGGSDGSYTFVEDNTGHNFKITTSTVDLKPHVGHDVTLVGQKAIAMATSAAVDNGFAVTSLNMISDNCAAAAAAPAASISMPADNAIPPPTDAIVPANTTAPADAASLATAAPAALPMTITPPAAETAITPTVAAPAPAAIAPIPAETASAPAVATTSDAKEAAETAAAPTSAHRTGLPADNRRPSATSTRAAAADAEIVSAPAETSRTPVADAATLPATDTTASATVADSAPAAAIPVVAAKGISSWLWIPIVVVVLILGAVAPMLNRWRKRKLLRQSRDQNLSFSHRAISEPGTSDKPTGRKAA